MSVHDRTLDSRFTITVHPWDVQLSQNVAALRHLPPGTTLNPPSGATARNLLDYFATAAPSTNDLTRLGAAVAEALALLSLARLLDIERQSALVGIARPDLDAQHGPIGTVAGVVPPSSGEISWFDRIDPTAGRRELSTAFNEYRGAVTSTDIDNRERSRGNPCHRCLLLDLIRVAGSEDPVQWLIDHRLRECALLVLPHLLAQIEPTPREPAVRASTSRDIHSKARSKDVAVRMSRLELEATHVRLVGRVQFRIPPELRAVASEPGVLQGWAGITRVTDDEGQRYVVTNTYSFQSHWRGGERYKGDLTVSCWPAPSAGVRSLRLDADPVVFSIGSDRCGCGTHIAAFVPPSEPLTLDITLPSASPAA